MTIRTVQVTAGAGPVTLRVESPEFPQALAGVVWRYGADKSAEGSAGRFTPEITDIPLGAPVAIESRRPAIAVT